MKKISFLMTVTLSLLISDSLSYEKNKDHSDEEKIEFIWDLYSDYQTSKKTFTEEQRIQKLEINSNENDVTLHKGKNSIKKELPPVSYFEKKAKIEDKSTEELYPFTLYNSNLSYFSMQQANEIVLNSSLFISNRSNELLEKYTDSIWAKTLLNLTLGITYFSTVDVWGHEEGHRSILSYHDIASHNAWSDGAVDEVSTKILNDFKKDNFVDFIRLHTAGIESEAVLIDEFEEKLLFENHHPVSAYVPLWTHKLINYMYISSQDEGDGNHYDNNDNYNNFDELIEEKEMDRDIVGHDVYGFVRHLFTKKDVTYEKRYSNIDEFTPEQKSYHDRIVDRAWINFLDMNLFRMLYGKIDVYGYDASVGFNYYLSPFGDVTDLNIITASKKSKNKLTLRQLGNHNDTFYAVQFKDYRRNFDDFWLTSTVNVWQNPKEFDFFTAEKFYGASLALNIEYKINETLNISSEIFSKTKGFLPGVNDDNLQSMSSVAVGIVLKY
jgi:hypothetical protein